MKKAGLKSRLLRDDSHSSKKRKGSKKHKDKDKKKDKKRKRSGASYHEVASSESDFAAENKYERRDGKYDDRKFGHANGGGKVSNPRGRPSGSKTQKKNNKEERM